MRARDNPFRSERIQSLRYRFLDGAWDGLWTRLESLGFRAAIVGPQGSGKTTLLEELATRLRASGREIRELRLDTETPRFDPKFLEELFASLGPRDVILFDGAEQLTRFEWGRFKHRAAGGLVVTSHRPGLLPTVLQTATTPELLEGLVSEILGDRAAEMRDRLPGLYERHAGNLREALRELYDACAASAPVRV